MRAHFRAIWLASGHDPLGEGTLLIILLIISRTVCSSVLLKYTLPGPPLVSTSAQNGAINADVTPSSGSTGKSRGV